MSALALRPPAPLEGEVLAPGTGTGFTFSPSPFKAGVRRLFLPAGATLEDAVRMTGVGPRLRKRLGVYIADQRIPAHLWRRIRLKPGAELFIRLELGDGEGAKDVFRTILVLAAAVVGFFFGGIQGALQFAAIASALVNVLIPPPKPKADPYTFDQQPGNPYAAITGIRNQFAPYAPIPRVIGQRRMYPPLAARPYTEVQGNIQYLRMLLLVGYGPLDISDIRIGNTPITAFAGAQVEVREGWASDAQVSLYTKQIQEEALSIKLDPSVWNTRATEPGTQEVSIDIVFPYGLAWYKPSSGKKFNRRVESSVEWSADGAVWNPAQWIVSTIVSPSAQIVAIQQAGLLVAEAASATTEVVSGRFPVAGNAQGIYQVRVRRNTAAGGEGDVDTAYWAVLRSVKQDNPIAMAGLALIALRLQATEQLNGAPDTINCIAHSYLPVYDGVNWAYQRSRNPAWGYADVLRRRGVATMIGDERIDLNAIKTWADACDGPAPNAQEPYWRCDAVLEGGSVKNAAQMIAAHGRAQFTLVDGKYSIVRDVAQTTPVQHISPRNSSNYVGGKAFQDLPHAFRVTFVNPDRNDAQDEVIVYRDGYDEDGSGGNIAASKFETLDFPFCRSASQAWREGRYQWGVVELRPEEHSVSMDFEALRCTNGDLVRFSHDVIKVGLASGRIAALEYDSAGLVTAIQLDIATSMSEGFAYAIRVRGRDFSSTTHAIALDVSEPTGRFVLASPTSADIQIGDLATFGESGIETAPMIVKNINRGPNFTARVTMVDAQSGVYTADQGPIPDFESFINRSTPVQESERPSRPALRLRSDETALQRTGDGTLVERLEVTLEPYTANTLVPATRWAVEYRIANSHSQWIAMARERMGLPIFIAPVAQGDKYDVRARVISAFGVPSEWAYSFEHTIIGKTSAPNAPTSFSATAGLDGVFVNFVPSASLDVIGYDIRYGGANWDAATKLGLVRGAAFFTLILTGSAVTFRVKALDAVGNYSTEVTAASAAYNARLEGAYQSSNPLVTGASAYRTPINPLSSSDAGSTSTVAIAAHTLKASSGAGAANVVASYNSGSVTGLSFATGYHIFAYDPTLAGGAVTYVASTSAETYVTNRDYIWIGYIVTVNDGGGGGSSPPPPPEQCVAAWAWIDAARNAGAIAAGDIIDVLGEDMASVTQCCVAAAKPAKTLGYRLTTTSGVTLTCSESTPITQPSGLTVRARDALGALVAVDDALGLRWEAIVEKVRVGIIDVARIHIGGRTYAAGDEPGRRMFTHNPLK